jgi:hypothetical protein
MIAAHYEERRRQLAEDRFGGICACGDHAWTRLTQGFVALVSAADADIIKEQAFSAKVRYCHTHATHFVRAGEDEGGHTISLQQEVLGDPPDGTRTDFKNGNALDCRRSNLRWATHSHHVHRAAHRKKGATIVSRFKGVSHKKGHWCVTLTFGGKPVHLGSFPMTSQGELAAARVYDDAARKLYGEFAASRDPLSRDRASRQTLPL